MTATRYAPPKARTADVGAPDGERQPWRRFETPATLWMRRIAALTLAASFFMPLTQCKGDDAPAAATMTEESVASACFVALAFFWPLLFEGLGRLADRLPVDVRFPLLRFCLIGCSSLVVASLTCTAWIFPLSVTLRYGVFVACGAITAYATSLVVLVRRRRWGRRVP